MIAKVADAPGVTEFGLIEHCGANAGMGDTEHTRETVLLNPLTAFTFTVAVEDCPETTGLGTGDDPESANVGKSGTILSSTLAE